MLVFEVEADCPSTIAGCNPVSPTNSQRPRLANLRLFIHSCIVLCSPCSCTPCPFAAARQCPGPRQVPSTGALIERTRSEPAQPSRLLIIDPRSSPDERLCGLGQIWRSRRW